MVAIFNPCVAVVVVFAYICGCIMYNVWQEIAATPADEEDDFDDEPFSVKAFLKEIILDVFHL